MTTVFVWRDSLKLCRNVSVFIFHEWFQHNQSKFKVVKQWCDNFLGQLLLLFSWLIAKSLLFCLYVYSVHGVKKISVNKVLLLMHLETSLQIFYLNFFSVLVRWTILVWPDVLWWLLLLLFLLFLSCQLWFDFVVFVFSSCQELDNYWKIRKQTLLSPSSSYL